MWDNEWVSHVDNVILSFSITEDETPEDENGQSRYVLMDQINAWLRENAGQRQEFGPELGYLHGSYGGAKCLETPLYIAAFNYLPESEFMDFLRSLPWREPDEVQVITKRQHEDVFVVLTLSVTASA